MVILAIFAVSLNRDLVATVDFKNQILKITPRALEMFIAFGRDFLQSISLTCSPLDPGISSGKKDAFKRNFAEIRN